MQFSELLGVVRQRWRLIAACVVLAVAAAIAVTLTTTPVYEARARIYLSAEQTSNSSSEGGVFVLTSEDLDTYVSILDTPAVLEPLREELGLEPGHPITVSAQTSGSTSILNITARAADGQEAADIANEVGPQLGKVAGEFSTLLKSSGQTVVSTPIQPASASSRPVSPDPVRNIGLGLLAGLVLGLGLAFVRHALDTKVRGEDDIRPHSDAPMLAGLPLERSSKSLVSVEDDPHGRHAEAIRRLRTNLMFVDVTTGRHSFVVTSAMPGEGKTTTAVNLALAMADSGRRTLLVDADLRNPSVARALGMEGSVGLTTVLLGDAEVHDVIQTWGSAGMDVLPSGQVPPNPSELLGSAPMEALLSSLVDEYDFVLVDSPPVVPVIDAVVVERLTGGLLMIVGIDRTKKKDLVAALKQLDTVGARVSGFARNFVQGKGGEYRYGYHTYEQAIAQDKRRGRRRAKERRASERARA
ncbi:polysaccharide biosynthesis tyrosine autokinase [Janibacter sp. YB324]|uniref:polysaccharide biosynthesis tyrosine autokinase n=1 Tax=Janibacter sp. YB324 TaxID=2761047 RepID=UPI001625B4AC|nr:polysaccharide biosynthesis tyrosine autokinase [Janibacter sp. YB324]QNF93459.1 polysaccharide biosynthesis tyrosine autokinase [Janibacter sp. YB324]